MRKDLVLGLHSGITETTASAWDRRGRLIARGRSGSHVASPTPNRFEQDAGAWWEGVRAALGELASHIDLRRIAALGIVNQRACFVPVDAKGLPLRPALLRLDEPDPADVAAIEKRLGAGKRDVLDRLGPDAMASLCALWRLLREEPAIARKAARIVEVQSLLVWHLTGLYRSSRTAALPAAILGQEAPELAGEVLDLLGLDAKRFAQPVQPGRVVGEVTRSAAGETGLEAGTLVVAGGGELEAVALGLDAMREGEGFLELGQAVGSGVYAAKPVRGEGFRTIMSLDGEGWILGRTRRTGIFLMDRLVRDIFGENPEERPSLLKELDKLADSVAPGAEGLVFKPYNRDGSRRGLLFGLAASHGRAHLYRAYMEGMALEQAALAEAVETAAGLTIDGFATVGPGARSRVWCGIIADATGRPLRRARTENPASLGAGMIAARGADWFGTVGEAAGAMRGELRDIIEPDPGRHQEYRRLLELFRTIDPAVRELEERAAELGPGLASSP